MNLKERTKCETCGAGVGGVMESDPMPGKDEPSLLIFTLIDKSDVEKDDDTWALILDLRLDVARKTANRLRREHLARATR